eukprot:5913260-Prymnesium_polylepis.1
MLPLHCVGGSASMALDCIAYNEPEVNMHFGMHIGPRLKEVPATFDGPICLALQSRGAISNLVLEKQSSPTLGADFDVLLSVRAVGLDFCDVLN